MTTFKNILIMTFI